MLNKDFVVIVVVILIFFNIAIDIVIDNTVRCKKKYSLFLK